MNSTDVRACREILRHGSRSFHAASRLLPREVGDAAAAIYAFCRVADDAVDEQAVEAGEPAVRELEGRLEAVYGKGRLDRAVDRAFRGAVERYGIPHAVPHALLEGLHWDIEGRTYENLRSLCDYAARVGSTVGLMLSRVMGVREEDTLFAAAELGIAMQLTNIARDVGEDAARGRIYLPLDRLREEGVAPDAWLADPEFEPGIGRTVGWLLDEADDLYRRSWSGIDGLPASSRPAIRAASLLYAEIGNRIRRAGLDSVSSRAWTDRRTKAAILLRAALRSRPPRAAFGGAQRASCAGPRGEARDAARFLVAVNLAGGEGYEDRP